MINNDVLPGELDNALNALFRAKHEHARKQAAYFAAKEEYEKTKLVVDEAARKYVEQVKANPEFALLVHASYRVIIRTHMPIDDSSTSFRCDPTSLISIQGTKITQ